MALAPEPPRQVPPPLVALHGFTGSPRTFARLDLSARSSRDPWIPYLVGHGPEPLLSSQTFDQEVARLAASFARDSEPVFLVGYSMGARVALGLLLARPEVVCGALLFGVNPGLETKSARQERNDWEAAWIRLLDEEGIEAFIEKWEALPLFSSQMAISEADKSLQRAARRSHTAVGLSHALRVLGLGAMPNLWPRLCEIRCPLHLAVGSLDDKFLAIARRMKVEHPGFHLHVLENVGHNPLIETPDRASTLLHQCLQVSAPSSP